MALPALSIPQFPLPFHISADIHPCVIHLAVALPVVIVLMELVNLVIKKRTLGVFSFVLMILLALVLFGAYLTGSVDAEHAKSALTGEAKTLFEAHKLQGIYLVYGAAVLVVIKLLSVLIRKTPMRVIFLIFLLAFTALTVNTAKKGKQLVFDYGINVKTVSTAPAVASTPVAESALPAEQKMKSEEKKPEAAPAAPENEEKAAETAPKAKEAAPEAPAATSEAAAPAEEMNTEEEKKVGEKVEKAQEESAPAKVPSAPNVTEVPAAEQ